MTAKETLEKILISHLKSYPKISTLKIVTPTDPDKINYPHIGVRATQGTQSIPNTPIYDFEVEIKFYWQPKTHDKNLIEEIRKELDQALYIKPMDQLAANLSLIDEKLCVHGVEPEQSIIEVEDDGIRSAEFRLTFIAGLK